MNLFDLNGRVAIVTGGNGGIGLGMATGLAQAGAAIVVAGRNAAKNAEAVKALEALGAKAMRSRSTSPRRPPAGAGRADGGALRPPRHPGQQRRHQRSASRRRPIRSPNGTR